MRRTLIAAVLGLAVACPSASAQLPQLPQLPLTSDRGLLPAQDGAVGEVLPGGVVEDVVNQPLPAPVEDVVSGSPVAPIREEVRRIVGQTGTGGDPTGGDAPGAGSSGTPPAGTAGTSDPDAGERPSTGGTGGNGRRRPGRTSSANSSDRTGTGPGTGTADSAARRSRVAKGGRQKTAAEDKQNPIVRTIVQIVRVVPTVLWVALGLLAALALALGARAVFERRRSRDLELDRRRLIRDVGVLERALLPSVPERLGALAVSVAHRACEGPAAGGDFYDAFELSDDRVALLVGDVSGHGPDALERTNLLRTAIRASLEAGLSPRLALESGARSSGIESGGQFATVVVALHDAADGTLTYAAAGHPPPILTGRGAHEPLTVASSPPAGVGLRTGLRETTIPLPSDTVACFFTDGLLEARMSGDLIGREELTRFVAELGPEQFADSLLAQVVAVADETPDDMAVCVIRPVAGAETLSPRLETLELDAEDITLGVAARFLEACEVPEYQAVTAVEALTTTAAAAGAAVLEVCIDESGPRVRVTRGEGAYRVPALTGPPE
jgi:hypothetical protein